MPNINRARVMSPFFMNFFCTPQNALDANRNVSFYCFLFVDGEGCSKVAPIDQRACYAQ